jgi:hypothetical protein
MPARVSRLTEKSHATNGSLMEKLLLKATPQRSRLTNRETTQLACLCKMIQALKKRAVSYRSQFTSITRQFRSMRFLHRSPRQLNSSHSMLRAHRIKTAKFQSSFGRLLMAQPHQAQWLKSNSQPQAFSLFTLTVDDGKGFENSKQSVQGEVLINSSPIIVTESVIRSNTRRILLDASKSYDIDKHALSFEWLLPDGKQTKWRHSVLGSTQRRCAFYHAHSR